MKPFAIGVKIQNEKMKSVKKQLGILSEQFEDQNHMKQY